MKNRIAQILWGPKIQISLFKQHVVLMDQPAEDVAPLQLKRAPALARVAT